MQAVQKTVEFPQVQFLDKVVVLPVLVQDKSLGPDSAENRAALGQVVVLPVMVHDWGFGPDSAKIVLEVPQMQFWRGCGQPCAHAATIGRSLRFSHRQGRDDLRMCIFAAVCSMFRTPSAWT